MAQMLPWRPTVDAGDGVRIDAIDEEAADAVFEALSSSTARSIFAAVHDEPAPASELADAAETSLQNAQYHLEKLEAADLIEPADTWYSEQGREMTVYGPSDTSLVVVAGDEETVGSVRSLLKRVAAATTLLVGASVGVQVLLRRDIGGGDGARTAEAGAGTADAATAAAGGSALPAPGLLFLAGGLFVLAVGIGWWAVRRK